MTAELNDHRLHLRLATLHMRPRRPHYAVLLLCLEAHPFILYHQAALLRAIRQAILLWFYLLRNLLRMLRGV